MNSADIYFIAGMTFVLGGVITMAYFGISAQLDAIRDAIRELKPKDKP